MKKAIWVSILAITAICFRAEAQDKYYTKGGKISFFSTAPIENITAVNKSSVCLLNTKTGDVQFFLLLKGFEFRKALMQEHFNSDYVESDSYPKSEFNGQITNNSSVNYSTAGSYRVTVKGKLTLHGVTQDVSASGTITVKGGQVVTNASFNITLANYKITIPKMYRDNISPTVKVSVDCTLDPLKQ